MLNSLFSLETNEFWAFWLCFLKLENFWCASTGNPANEKAFLFPGSWSPLSRLTSSSDQSRSSSKARYASGGGLAEARKVSNCCSRCNLNSLGKALFVVDSPGNSKSMLIFIDVYAGNLYAIKSVWVLGEYKWNRFEEEIKERNFFLQTVELGPCKRIPGCKGTILVSIY